MTTQTIRRPRVTSAELRLRISELQAELKPLKALEERVLAQAQRQLPVEARLHYDGLSKVASQQELQLFLDQLEHLLMEAAKVAQERYLGEHDSFGLRVHCPLCNGRARSPYAHDESGWGYPKGLQQHLRRTWPHHDNGCPVMQALVEHANRKRAQLPQ